MANDTSLESLLRHERLCWEALVKTVADTKPHREMLERASRRWRQADEIALEAMRESIGGAYDPTTNAY
jgi:hypothetical protein